MRFIEKDTVDVYVVLQREMLVSEVQEPWNSKEVRYENMKFQLPALGGRDRWSASCVPTRKSRAEVSGKHYRH